MNVINNGKKKELCEGPCPYEPLIYPGGTLSDGTTYSFTSSTGATVIDLGNGTIEHGSSNDSLTVTFSQLVDFRFTNAVAPTTRVSWHGVNENVSTRAETDGSAWCLQPGTQPTPININGKVADGNGHSGVDGNFDWGTLESFSAKEITVRAYVWDAYNYEARPRSVTCKQPICSITDDLRKKVNIIQENPPASETLTSMSLVGDIITYNDEDGNATNLTLNHPEQEICTGIYNNCNNRSGWWQGWSPVITANQGTETLIDWRTLGTGTVTSPNCLSDMTFQANAGNHYLRNRRNRTYIWIDYRLVLNGAVVYTRSNQIYRYSDERDEQSDNGGAPSIPVNIENWGAFNDHRDNIPANSTVEVQIRLRWNINASQSDSYTRYIGGIYSRATFQFSPNSIVTGRL